MSAVGVGISDGGKGKRGSPGLKGLLGSSCNGGGGSPRGPGGVFGVLPPLVAAIVVTTLGGLFGSVLGVDRRSGVFDGDAPGADTATLGDEEGGRIGWPGIPAPGPAAAATAAAAEKGGKSDRSRLFLHTANASGSAVGVTRGLNDGAKEVGGRRGGVAAPPPALRMSPNHGLLAPDDAAMKRG